MKYSDLLREWAENCVKPSSKYRTYTRYCEIIDDHIVPNLGDFEIHEMSLLDVQCFVTKLKEEGNIRSGMGLSANTVNSIITVIQASLKVAYQWGIIDEYYGDRIKRPKVYEKSVECFSLEEQRKIENFVINSKKESLSGIIICLYTGIRLGELLALTWDDIDFDNNELHITKTCYYGKTENGNYSRITDVPKTQSSNRIIPLPQQLMPILRNSKKNNDFKYVISVRGKCVSVRSYQRMFSVMLKKLDIPHRGFHSLRHTFATRAIECGVDVKTLSEILGHKSSIITLNRYVHSLMEHKKQAMNKLGMLL